MIFSGIKSCKIGVQGLMLVAICLKQNSINNIHETTTNTSILVGILCTLLAIL